MPKQTTAAISYSIKVKVNIGNYESVDAHFGLTETWDVSDLSDAEAIAAFENERHNAIKTVSDERAAAFQIENS